MASESSNQATESQQNEQQGQENQRADGQSQQGQDQQGQSQMNQDQQSFSYDDIEDNAPVRKNDPRTSVQKTEEYRFANNIPGDQTIPEKAYADYTLEYDDGGG